MQSDLSVDIYRLSVSECCIWIQSLNRVTSSFKITRALGWFSLPHLSVGNVALHPQRDDFLKGHGAEGALQADRRSHVHGPHQGDEEGFAELCEEQSAGQTDAANQGGRLWSLDVLQDLIDQNSLRQESQSKIREN